MAGYTKGNQQQQTTAIATTADPRYQNLKRILELSKSSIGQIVSKVVSPDELVRLFLNSACKTPDLLKCADDPRGIASIGLALMKAAAMGLRPDGRNGHLLPLWNGTDKFMECQFWPDYKGMVKLMCQSPKVATVQCNAVRENDVFDFEYGSEKFLRHKPALQERGELIAAYAYYTTPNGDCEFRVMTAAEVLKRRDVSRSAKSPYSPWEKWPDEMWAKSALHNVAKVAPLGEVFERALRIDEMDEAGSLTEDELKAVSHDANARLEYVPAQVATFSTQDNRESVPTTTKQSQKPVQQEPKQLLTTQDYLDRINGALNASVIDKLWKEIQADHAESPFADGDLERLKAACDQKKNGIK